MPHYTYKKVFQLRKFCFFIRKSINFFWFSDFASYLLKYKKHFFIFRACRVISWNFFRSSVSWNIRNSFGSSVSWYIRKAFFWENARNFSGVSASWSIRNFLGDDFFYRAWKVIFWNIRSFLGFPFAEI